VPQQIGGGSWAPSAPTAYSGGGGANAGGTVATVAWTPRPKNYLLAVILSFFFGPFGLFYASKKGSLVLLILLFGVPYTLASLGAYGPAFHRQPLEIIGRDAVMNRFWVLAVMISLAWSVVGVMRYNKQFKKNT
jgi:hypothetical protein